MTGERLGDNAVTFNRRSFCGHGAGLGVSLVLGSCTSNPRVENGKVVVSAFRKHLNDADYEALWSLFSTKFHTIHRFDVFKSQFTEFSKRIGPFETTSRHISQFSSTGSFELLTLTYSSMFKKAKMAENFTFISEGGRERINGYFTDFVAARVNF